MYGTDAAGQEETAMTEHLKPHRRAHRLPPCPAYDVEGLESWLADLAEQEGLFLAEDGFFLGFAHFEQGTPRAVRYRLEAAPKRPSLWADDGGRPDPETLALAEEYGWEYVAPYQDFYIYRARTDTARELNTAPAVQAAALNAVCKRQRAALIRSLLYPALCLCLGLFTHSAFRTLIEVGSWYFLLLTVLVLWLFFDTLAEFFYLRRLRQRLRSGGAPTHKKNWKKRAALHRGKSILQLVLLAACLALFLTLHEERIPLADCQETPPFATLAEFAGPDVLSYRSTMTGQKFNTVRIWSDWLAPYNVSWSEQAAVRRADGTTLDGGLWVDYHQAANAWIARQLALEYARSDAHAEGASPLELPPLAVDYACAYTDLVGFPVVTLQKGDKIVHVTFGFYGQAELDEWARRMAESIQ